MQVNRVQNTPNFGMALRVKPEAVNALKKMTRSEVEELQKVGEELKDTVFYHLEIGHDGERTIVSPFASRYRGGTFMLNNPTDEILKFSARWAGPESGNLKYGDLYPSAIKFANAEAAKSAYNDISNCGLGIAKDAKMVKYLDARAIEKDKYEKDITAEKKAVEEMVGNLFEKFGVNE